MELSVGEYLWIPCEVKPGPFSNERMVRVESEFDVWLGFVPVDSLKEPILEGKTEIRAFIVDAKDGNFFIKLPGEAVTNSLHKDEISKVQSIGTL
jgi:hypothetical protein